jgi:PAS domain S-box-containing protein
LKLSKEGKITFIKFKGRFMMNPASQPESQKETWPPSGLTLNLAIVGGGRTCKRFLKQLQINALPFLNINIIGVCDIDPKAEGLLYARELGICTTADFEDFFNLRDLDGIVELTYDKKVLGELIRKRPQHVGIMEHNIARFLTSYLALSQKTLRSAEQQIVLEQMISDFMMQLKNEPIVMLNRDFSIEHVNSAFLSMTGKTKEEVIGSYCYKIIYGYNAHCSSAHPENECPMIETLRTGESAHVIHESTDLQTSPSYCHVVSYPIKNQEGQIVKVIEIWQDITEKILSRWEKRARELKDDLNQLVQEDRMISLGKLAASCVHEINNPIQGLLMFSRLIQDSLSQDKLKRKDIDNMKYYASLMSSEIERCGNIISGLLSFARETSNEYKEVDLNEVLESVIALTQHKMSLTDIKLVNDISQEPLAVRGDRNQLQQCFLNIIFNAMEAMPDGGQLSIVSKKSRDAHQACLEFRDTGCGIAKENLDNIFDPFFSSKKKGQATGLGLSIVHGVVKSHCGEIRLDSNVGSGTTFILDFPLYTS